MKELAPKIVNFLKRDIYTWFGGVLVVWNITHKDKGPTISSMASRHPIITAGIMAAYLHHFNEERIADGISKARVRYRRNGSGQLEIVEIRENGTV